MEITTEPITKEDIQNAQPYRSNTDCLIATLLKRSGYPNVWVTPYRVDIDGRSMYPKTNSDNISADAILVNGNQSFLLDRRYKPELIGKRFTFVS